MHTITNEREYLVYLLHCAFNDKAPQRVEGINYSALIKLASKHQVLNAIIPALSGMDDLESGNREYLRSYSMNCIRTALATNAERQTLFAELAERNVRIMPLKGYLLRRYYPKESMRQMGDTDIYYDEANRDIVAQLMSEYGYKNFSSGENSDDYENEAGYIFEFHRSLFYHEAEFNPVFDNLWEHATVDQDEPTMYYMGVDDLYVHTVCHMYKHFTSGGCGIRFLADIYLMLRTEYDNIDWQLISTRMTEYGIVDFEQSVRELAMAMFQWQELTDIQQQLLDIILDFGIFGNEKNKIAFRFRQFAGGENIDSAMRRKYIISRLFPPKAKMIADHRVLEKHIYLLPFFYIYRFFKAALNFKKTKNEIGYINSTD